ncbi:MAG: hypothetical protein PWR13_1129 [Archaeoglobi archaeon]|nr:hypothetical protein [Candidatus Mnemosynella bozhongmuii]MDI3502899.1 hypothetical protein [Archaeoglobi archaeon]MDK2782101.1 hypothetical protein [Archaeoglobi archaeon]
MRELHEVRGLFERIFNLYERFERTGDFEIMKELSHQLEELSSHLSSIVLVAEVERTGSKTLLDFINKISSEINEVVLWIKLGEGEKEEEVLELLSERAMLPLLLNKLKVLYGLIF